MEWKNCLNWIRQLGVASGDQEAKPSLKHTGICITTRSLADWWVISIYKHGVYKVGRFRRFQKNQKRVEGRPWRCWTLNGWPGLQRHTLACFCPHFPQLLSLYSFPWYINFSFNHSSLFSLCAFSQECPSYVCLLWRLSFYFSINGRGCASLGRSVSLLSNSIEFCVYLHIVELIGLKSPSSFLSQMFIRGLLYAHQWKQKGIHAE